MLGLEWVENRQDALDNFMGLMSGGRFFALVSKTDKKAIGHICIHPPTQEMMNKLHVDSGGMSLSFALHRAYQNSGIMSEALGHFAKRLLDNGNSGFIECSCLSENVACQKLLKKSGFKYIMTINSDVSLRYYLLRT